MIIKFIKYDTDSNLYCNGICTLNIDGINMTFGNHDNCDFPKFWSSGGNYDTDGNVTVLPWVKNKFNLDDFPDDLLNELNTMLQLFNENVPYGCCGECV